MAAMMPLHLISGRLVISNVHGHVAISTPQCCHSGVEKKLVIWEVQVNSPDICLTPPPVT